MHTCGEFYKPAFLNYNNKLKDQHRQYSLRLQLKILKDFDHYKSEKWMFIVLNDTERNLQIRFSLLGCFLCSHLTDAGCDYSFMTSHYSCSSFGCRWLYLATINNLFIS